MIANLLVLDSNGTAEALSGLSSHDACLNQLAHLSGIGTSMAQINASCGLNLWAPSMPHLDQLLQRARALEQSAAGVLLRALPLGSSNLRPLMQLSELAGAVSLIRQSLGVDLFDRNAAGLLLPKLKLFGSATPFTLPALPEIDLKRFVQFGAVTAAIRDGFGINLLAPGGGRLFGDAMLRLNTGGVFMAIPRLPIGAATLAGLQRFMLFGSTLQTAIRGLGFNPFKMAEWPKLTAMLRLLQKGGSLHLICMDILGGVFGANVGLRLPGLDILRRLTWTISAIRLIRQSLGIDLLQRDAGLLLRRLIDAFRGNNICGSLAAQAPRPKGLDALNRVQTLGLGLQTSRDAAGVDLLHTDGAAGLAAMVDNFRNPENPVQAMRISPSVVEGLSGLSMLGQTARAAVAGI